MKIAVTSTGPTLDDSVEARFGRCAYFLVVDTNTMQCEPIENPNIGLGAGIQSAQLMSEKGVTTVLTGYCGSNAFNVFGQARIQVVVGFSGPIRNAVEEFKQEAFSFASEPNVVSHFGVNSSPTNPGALGQTTTAPPSNVAQ
jgi:predicted Fe-Mo cluster-binding NifX family protein